MPDETPAKSTSEWAELAHLSHAEAAQVNELASKQAKPQPVTAHLTNKEIDERWLSLLTPSADIMRAVATPTYENHRFLRVKHVRPPFERAWRFVLIDVRLLP